MIILDIKVFLEKNSTFKELICYSFVGFLNLIIDLCVVNFLMFITKIYKGPILTIFSIISFFVYSLNGYKLNKKYTFKTAENSYMKYISVLALSVIIESPLFSLFSMFNVFSLNEILWANISKIVSFSIGGTLCFIINKHFVFRKKS